jgi:type VI protein secretion system component Hcp
VIIVSFETLKSVSSSYVGFEGYTGWFVAESIDFGHGVQYRAGKTGDNGGPSLDMFVEKGEKNELSISKMADEFTPYLMFKAATDRKLKSKAGELIYISFLAVRAGAVKGEDDGIRSWVKFLFGTCFLTEWSVSGSGGGAGEAGVPTETLKISYNQIAMSYKPPHKASGAATPIKRSVDLTKLGSQQAETAVRWTDGENKLT